VAQVPLKEVDVESCENFGAARRRNDVACFSTGSVQCSTCVARRSPGAAQSISVAACYSNFRLLQLCSAARCVTSAVL
jgi:hypothetical protein